MDQGLGLREQDVPKWEFGSEKSESESEHNPDPRSMRSGISDAVPDVESRECAGFLTVTGIGFRNRTRGITTVAGARMDFAAPLAHHRKTGERKARPRGARWTATPSAPSSGSSRSEVRIQKLEVRS